MNNYLYRLLEQVKQEIKPILDARDIAERWITSKGNYLENSPEMVGADYSKYIKIPNPVVVPEQKDEEEDKTEFFLQPPGSKMIGFNWGKSN